MSFLDKPDLVIMWSVSRDESGRRRLGLSPINMFTSSAKSST